MAPMPAVLLNSDRTIVLGSRPEPPHRPDQVIVDVDLCGICGSDLHAPGLPEVYRGGFVLGHEAAGRIAYVGAEVDGWQVGQPVSINPNGNVCGVCDYCRTGRPNFCVQATMETALGLQMDGGLAPKMAVFPGTLRAVPDAMGRIEAAWVEPTATALRAVELAGDIRGATVLVSGGGPIGQLACRIAAFKGAARIILVEPAPERRRFGPASHADLALTPAEAAAHERAGDLPVDAVIECSGSAAATRQGIGLLVPGGVLVVVGAGPGSGLDPTAILLKELTVRGSFIYDDEFDRAIDLLADHVIQVADLTTAITPVRDAPAAIETLRAADTMKVLIAPGA
jgi:threonine dehydrogenase-like Zn-dependent dehydrogenase